MDTPVIIAVVVGCLIGLLSLAVHLWGPSAQIVFDDGRGSTFTLDDTVDGQSLAWLTESPRRLSPELWFYAVVLQAELYICLALPLLVMGVVRGSMPGASSTANGDGTGWGSMVAVVVLAIMTFSYLVMVVWSTGDLWRKGRLGRARVYQVDTKAGPASRQLVDVHIKVAITDVVDGSVHHTVLGRDDDIRRFIGMV